MTDIDHAYAEANECIQRAQDAYNKTLVNFRSAIKNDLASISASGDKVRAEAAKIQAACTASVSLMTSPGMVAAIENAERLSAALRAISELQSHSITFAVLDRKPEST